MSHGPAEAILASYIYTVTPARSSRENPAVIPPITATCNTCIWLATCKMPIEGFIIKCVQQGLCQDLETGCPKLTIVKFLGVPLFLGRPQYTQITTTNMHLLCIYMHWNNAWCPYTMSWNLHWGETKINGMLENNILRNSSRKNVCVLRGDFLRFVCPNDAQTLCWLKLWRPASGQSSKVGCLIAIRLLIMNLPS